MHKNSILIYVTAITISLLLETKLSSSKRSRKGVEELSKMGKGLLDMDPSVVGDCRGRGNIKGLNDNGKNAIKCFKKTLCLNDSFQV